jgi:hypothetical protein
MNKHKTTYEDSSAYRESLMKQGTAYAPGFWEGLHEKFKTLNVAAANEHKRRSRKFGFLLGFVPATCAGVLYLAGAPAVAFFPALFVSAVLAYLLRYSVANESGSLKPYHLLSSFDEWHFEQVKDADFDEIWRFAAVDRWSFEYVKAALAHRSALLNIEVVLLRHRRHQLAEEQKQVLAARAKVLLSSSEPADQELLEVTIAAAEFYRNNPSAARHDFNQRFRHVAQPA